MAIITNLGKQFDNTNFREFCDGRNFDFCFASVGHPQTNWLFEATNKTIKKLLKKKTPTEERFVGWRITQRIMGIQDNQEDCNRGNPLLASIRDRSGSAYQAQAYIF